MSNFNTTGLFWKCPQCEQVYEHECAWEMFAPDTDETTWGWGPQFDPKGPDAGESFTCGPSTGCKFCNFLTWEQECKRTKGLAKFRKNKAKIIEEKLMILQLQKELKS